MDKLEQAVSDVLDTLLSVERQEDGTFSCEIYADYRDEMDDKTAIKLLRSEYPMPAFWEQLDEWYQDYQWELGDELEKEVRAKLTATDGPYPEGFSDDDDDRMLDTLHHLFLRFRQGELPPALHGKIRLSVSLEFTGNFRWQSEHLHALNGLSDHFSPAGRCFYIQTKFHPFVDQSCEIVTIGSLAFCLRSKFFLG